MPRKPNVSFDGRCVCQKLNCGIPFGYCHCGCGKKTHISKWSDTKNGKYSGYPTAFILGHQGADRSGIVDTGGFKIDGKPCRLIPLTKGQYAIVDEANFEIFNSHKYHARIDPETKKMYAARSVRIGKNKILVYMHREVLGMKDDGPEQIDHIEPMATTDNRVDNLRVAPSQDENMWNKRKRRDSHNRYKCVYFHPLSGLYRVMITVHGKKISLGYYRTPEEGRDVHEAAVKEYHGKFGRTK